MRWLLLVLFLSSCGLSTLLPLGGSGGPTVNSNAQIGAENRQAVMSVEQTEEITAHWHWLRILDNLTSQGNFITKLGKAI